MKSIQSYEVLEKELRNLENAYLFIYKSGSEQSECALRNLEEAVKEHSELPVFLVDVNQVRDIHERYNITTAPVLIELEGLESRNVIKGCHQDGFLRAFFGNALYKMQARKEGKVPKRVTVYTSPTCSWCSTVKSYLRKNQVPFREVDISRDENAARELVRRSGQQGVPQTDINGQIVVGFDQARLDRLLEIE